MAHTPSDRNRRRPLLEALETRDLPAAGPREQYMLELVNRFRAAPQAELPILLADADVNAALNFFNVDRTLLQQQFAQLTPMPPLAWSDEIAAAARGHSQEMLARDALSHQFPGEPAPGDRIRNAGYDWAGFGENAFHAATSVFNGHAAWAIDWGSPGPRTVGGIQNPSGHRNSLMSANFTDFGVGIVDATPGKRYGPLYMTQNFGRPANAANPFLLGVVYRDANNNGGYDVGEGIATTDVTVTGPGGPFTATTSSEGYYQLRLPAGDYTVTAAGVAGAQPVNRTVGASNVKADIRVADNAAAPTLRLENATAAVRENAGTLRLKALRGGNAAVAVSVPVTATAGTAQTPANFTLVTTNLDFAVNETQKDIEITIVNIAGVNGDLTFSVTLGAPTVGQLGVPATTTVTIQDNDVAPAAQVRLERATYTVRENAGSLAVKVQLAAAAPGPLSVRIATANGTAQAGRDYTAVDQNVAFAAGDSEKTLSLPVLDNARVDGNRTLTVTLSGPNGATLGTPAQATITIEDDDIAANNRVQLTQVAYTVKENAGNLRIKATRTGDVSQAVTVGVRATDGTALNNVNYSAANAAFNFAANASEAEATFGIVNIPGANGNLAFTVALNPAAGGPTASAPSSATITIEDVDAPAGGGNNRPPVANDDRFVLRTGDARTSAIALLTNDTDADGDPLSARIAAQGRFGTATVAADNMLTYVPGPTFWGVDTISYQANDGKVDSNTAKAQLISHTALQVRKVFLQVLNREPDEGGWKYWTDQLTGGRATLGAVASGIFESPERLDPIIRQYYRDFLLREAEANGLAYWRGIWQADGGPERVLSGMVGSPEFFQSAGGTNRLWTTELYRRLLKREPEAAGAAYWTARLDEGTFDRPRVVLFFVQSEENFRNLVKGWHQQYLSRPATPAEEDRFTTQLKNGASQRSVQIAIIDSQEYLNNPVPPATGTAARV